MKIFHSTTPDRLREIRRSGAVKAQPHLVRAYNDDGEEDWAWRPRAFVCLTKADGKAMNEVLTNHGQKYVLAGFEVKDASLTPDPKFRGGYFAEEDLILQGG